MNKISKIPLLEVEDLHGNGGTVIAVPISHLELNHLVGRLMQMCDLTGDVDQRTALKSTIKQISRDWLDDQYEQHGYDKFKGIENGVKTIKVSKYELESQ